MHSIRGICSQIRSINTFNRRHPNCCWKQVNTPTPVLPQSQSNRKQTIIFLPLSQRSSPLLPPCSGLLRLLPKNNLQASHLQPLPNRPNDILHNGLHHWHRSRLRNSDPHRLLQRLQQRPRGPNSRRLQPPRRLRQILLCSHRPRPNSQHCRPNLLLRSRLPDPRPVRGESPPRYLEHRCRNNLHRLRISRPLKPLQYIHQLLGTHGLLGCDLDRHHARRTLYIPTGGRI